MRRVLTAMLVALAMSGSGALAGGGHPARAQSIPTTKLKGPLAGNTTTDVGKPAGTADKLCPKYPDKYSWCAPPAVPPPQTILVPVPLTVSCPSSTAAVSTAYSSAITAAGGFPPYASYAASSLPAGLNLNPSTGSITGTPTSAGTTTFTASVVDARGLSGSATCSITVSPAATLVASVGRISPFSYHLTVSGTQLQPGNLVIDYSSSNIQPSTSSGQFGPPVGPSGTFTYTEFVRCGIGRSDYFTATTNQGTTITSNTVAAPC